MASGAESKRPPGTGADTPVMRQYLAAKQAHPDAIVLFRLGDFYEVFFEDATIAARVLDLTLTSRNKGSEDAIPMAGVPHHAASGYIQRLLDAGHKVALCEQMADPSKVKGIVPREVVRVVSPGFVYDELGLDAKSNAYVAAIESDGAAFGLAALDLSTGELSCSAAHDLDTALAELFRIAPRELLVGPDAVAIVKLFKAGGSSATIEPMSSAVEPKWARDILSRTLGPDESLLDAADRLVRHAACRCIDAALRSEPGRPLPRLEVRYHEANGTLVLDETTQTHLELVRTLSGDSGRRSEATLLAQLDETRTPPGARLLRRRLLSPITEIATIRKRQDQVELFVADALSRRDLGGLLGRVADLERLAIKCVMARAGARDLLALRESLAVLPEINEVLARTQRALLSREPALLIPTCADLSDMLSRSISDSPPVKLADGGVIREGFDPELDEARNLAERGQSHIVALEGRLRDESGISSLKLKFTRVFGWYIEVTRTHVEKAPSTWRRKQTIANGERYTCDELDELADKLAHAEQRATSREAELFAEQVSYAAFRADELRAAARTLAEWDVAFALAEVAHRHDYTRPIVDDSLHLELLDSRHPVVERLAASGRFVPNDVVLDANPEDAESPRMMLVTGPNMAGKSTLMRQAAHAIILAQMGAFVPARKARIGVVDRILTRVGASDNVARGESTFMVEMKETAHVLRCATRRSFVVLDEIGRGTSTYDGLAIAWAVAEYLYDVAGCRSMFATHYHELTRLSESRSRLGNFSVSAREHEGEIVFLHKLIVGAASRSYGVACAKLAGLPEPVLERARQILEDLEGTREEEQRPSAPEEGPKARPRTTRLPRQAQVAQLGLFAKAEADPKLHPALEHLLALDVDRITPLEALVLLAKLKQKARA